VDTRSEERVKRDKIPVLASDAEGNPPRVSGVDWDSFDETWKYNVGREALAPNFSKYINLPKDTVKEVYKNYHKSMDETRLTDGEFIALVKRIREPGYKTLNIMYQVGNVEMKRFKAIQKKGINDSKVMGSDFDLWHGLADKVSDQAVKETFFGDVYQTFQEPEFIFSEKIPVKSTQEKILHFVKNTKNGKKIKIIVHVRTVSNGQTSMRIRTIGHSEYKYTGDNYDEITW
jgi:hypothetical protein